MIIQVAPLTPCAVSTADAEPTRIANALVALRMYWDRSCSVALSPDGRWQASRHDGGIVSDSSPAGLHRKLVHLAGGVPPLGRRPRHTHETPRMPASWIPGLAGRAGIWP